MVQSALLGHGKKSLEDDPFFEHFKNLANDVEVREFEEFVEKFKDEDDDGRIVDAIMKLTTRLKSKSPVRKMAENRNVYSGSNIETDVGVDIMSGTRRSINTAYHGKRVPLGMGNGKNVNDYLGDMKIRNNFERDSKIVNTAYLGQKTVHTHIMSADGGLSKNMENFTQRVSKINEIYDGVLRLPMEKKELRSKELKIKTNNVYGDLTRGGKHKRQQSSILPISHCSSNRN